MLSAWPQNDDWNDLGQSPAKEAAPNLIMDLRSPRNKWWMSTVAVILVICFIHQDIVWARDCGMTMPQPKSAHGPNTFAFASRHQGLQLVRGRSAIGAEAGFAGQSAGANIDRWPSAWNTRS